MSCGGSSGKPPSGENLEIGRKDTWRPVTARRYTAQSPLTWREGESLRTAAGVAHLTFSDGTRLSLNADSEIRMDGATPSAIRLSGGDVYALVPKPAGQPQAVLFLIRTDEAEARVTGTEFGVKKQADHTEVAVVEGSVVCAAPKGEVPVKAGQLTSVRPNAAPARPKPFDAKTYFAWLQAHHAPGKH